MIGIIMFGVCLLMLLIDAVEMALYVLPELSICVDRLRRPIRSALRMRFAFKVLFAVGDLCGALWMSDVVSPSRIILDPPQVKALLHRVGRTGDIQRAPPSIPTGSSTLNSNHILNP